MTMLCYVRCQSTRALKSLGSLFTTAFEHHRWYLSEIMIAFAFFDDAVTTEEKRLMVAVLHEVEGSDEPFKRIPQFQHPDTKTLHNFVKKHKQFLYDSWHIPGVLTG